ncbi:hypothetical protein HDU93_007232 [Gonapodya sp. JEL0774]|nr:hypothetical protein HDU93_007232 [Gonapodya sp. JEL0774]
MAMCGSTTRIRTLPPSRANRTDRTRANIHSTTVRRISRSVPAESPESASPSAPSEFSTGSPQHTLAQPPLPPAAHSALSLLPASPSRSITCGTVTLPMAGSPVALCGWLTHVRRVSGSTVFFTLRDMTGTVQIIHTLPAKDTPERDYHVRIRDTLLSLNQDSVLRCVGTVRPRPASSVNPHLPTGAIEVSLLHLEVLNPCPPLPFPTHELTPHPPPTTAPPSTTTSAPAPPTPDEPPEDLRLRHRHLDLRRPRLQSNLLLRSTILHAARTHLFSHEGLHEIETPYLTRSTPEGAREFLVPTRAKTRGGEFYALAQSPQQYKQMLMCAGFEGYFQIARCFRDEDARRDRQPEFTQIDLELSFHTQPSLLRLVERLILHIYQTALSLPLRDMYRAVKSPYGVPASLTGSAALAPALAPPPDTPPFVFPAVTYARAMSLYGSDKPDVRYGMEIHQIPTSAMRGAGWDVRRGWVVEGFVVPRSASVGWEKGKGKGVLEGWEREVRGQRREEGGKGFVVVEVRGDGRAWWAAGDGSVVGELEGVARRAGAEGEAAPETGTGTGMGTGTAAGDDDGTAAPTMGAMPEPLASAPAGSLVALSCRPARPTGGSTSLGRARLLLAARMRRAGVELPQPTPGVGVFGDRDGGRARAPRGGGGSVVDGKVVLRGGRTVPVPHFVWVVEFPMFTAVAEDGSEVEVEVDGGGLEADGGGGGEEGGGSGDVRRRLVSTHHPFTAPHPDSLVHLEPGGNPLLATALHHDLVLNGLELAGGSVRIHSADLQTRVLRDLLRLPRTQVDSFSHVVGMLDAGCPPHGGAAVGLDRLVAEMAGEEGIRDVVAFPKVWSAVGGGVMRDWTVGGPAGVAESALEEYGVKWVGKRGGSDGGSGGGGGEEVEDAG